MKNEIVYINNGEVYKTSATTFDTIPNHSIVMTTTSEVTGTTSVYYTPMLQTEAEVLSSDTLIPHKARKINSDGSVQEKYYLSTSQFRELIDMTGGVDINSYGVPLAGSVSVWGGVALIEDDDNFLELYFNVVDNTNMQDIADFYGLPNPLPSDNDLDINRSDWTLREYANGVDLVLGSIVFDDTTPTLLKVYKFDNG